MSPPTGTPSNVSPHAEGSPSDSAGQETLQVSLADGADPVSFPVAFQRVSATTASTEANPGSLELFAPQSIIANGELLPGGRVHTVNPSSEVDSLIYSGYLVARSPDGTFPSAEIRPLGCCGQA